MSPFRMILTVVAVASVTISCETGTGEGGEWGPDDYTVQCSDGMCLIPAGSFWMGCTAAIDADCSSDEAPYHEVTLSGYYMDDTEVTQSAYKECVDAGTCAIPGCNWYPAGSPDRPVVCIDWNQAKAYCEWAGKRLPTEAEWEKAARGTDGRKYPWGNQGATCHNANIYDDSGHGCGTGNTMSVCSKSPAGDSPYGLCDMSGNVWEWTADWYREDYYNSSPYTNPVGPTSGSGRVHRGGSFVNYDAFGTLRASLRNHNDDSDYYDIIGVRCARSQ